MVNADGVLPGGGGGGEVAAEGGAAPAAPAAKEEDCLSFIQDAVQFTIPCQSSRFISSFSALCIRMSLAGSVGSESLPFGPPPPQPPQPPPGAAAFVSQLCMGD